MLQNSNGKKWMVTTKRTIFNKLFFVLFKLDNAINCAKYRICTSQLYNICWPEKGQSLVPGAIYSMYDGAFLEGADEGFR